MNHRIRASYVRVIGKDGEQLGILDTREAVRLAKENNLDLVEVAGKADPPVCKIIDYGKYKYQEKKKSQAAKKKQVVVEVKEVQIRPKTEDHDLSHKAAKAIKFLEQGNKVKCTVFYRGRELQYLDAGWDTLIAFAQKLEGKALLDLKPKFEGRRIMTIFAPIPPAKKVAEGELMSAMEKPKNFVAPEMRPRTFRRR